MHENLSKTAPANFSLYPLAWLSVSFALGIFSENFLGFSWHVFLIICLVSTIFTIIFIKHKHATIGLLISFIALGALCFQIEKQSVAQNRLKILYDTNVFTSGDVIEITGILQGKPELAVGGFFLELKTESANYKGVEEKVSGNVRLFAPVRDEQIAQKYKQQQLRYGTRIRATCHLRREDKFLNPGVARAKEILDQKQIDATAVIKSPLLLENLGETKTFAPLAWGFERRQDLILDFKKHFSVSTAAVLIASLLGNRYHLDKPTSERFREGGTFHIVVISGLQITFIGGLTILFLRRFTKNRLWQFLMASAFLWSYTIIVGADIPVLRAAMMFTILHFAYVIFRSMTLLNSLGASPMALLIWRPSDLFDQSFQLTFACVIAIVTTAFPLLEKIKDIGEWHPTAETPSRRIVQNGLELFVKRFIGANQNGGASNRARFGNAIFSKLLTRKN